MTNSPHTDFHATTIHDRPLVLLKSSSRNIINNIIKKHNSNISLEKIKRGDTSPISTVQEDAQKNLTIRDGLKISKSVIRTEKLKLTPIKLTKIKIEKKHKFKFGYKSQEGVHKTGQKKINQDSYLAVDNQFGINFSVFSVFDGHGIIDDN